MRKPEPKEAAKADRLPEPEVLAAKGKPLDKMFGKAITILQRETSRKRHYHMVASNWDLSSSGKDRR